MEGEKLMETLKCDFCLEDTTLVAVLSGTLDHHSARGAREAIDREIVDCSARRLVLELSSVEFMDSAGIGLILGRYNKIGERGGELVLRSPSEAVSRLMRLSGVDRFIIVERAESKK